MASDWLRTSITYNERSSSVSTTSVATLVPIQPLSWTLPGIKRSQRQADHTSQTDDNNPYRFTSTPPSLPGKVFRYDKNFTLPYPARHILRRDTMQFLHLKLCSLTCAALAWKRKEEPGHAATHIITLWILSDHPPVNHH